MEKEKKEKAEFQEMKDIQIKLIRSVKSAHF